LNDDNWKDFESIQTALRNSDIKRMDKNWIRERMQAITGESGIPEADGKIYKAISD
jgi:hypothetical protein